VESQSYAEGMRYENWRGKGSNYTDGSAYGQSKLANVFMAQQLYRRFGVASVSVHPGIIATDLGRYRTISGFLDYMIGFLVNSARMNADQGSWNQLWAAVQRILYHPKAPFTVVVAPAELDGLGDTVVTLSGLSSHSSYGIKCR
jgi:NAD(P)-dependent dehydrogenase (short-subunit alcohol dehydrogenase family)